MLHEISENGSADNLSTEFKQKVSQWDSAGILDKIAAEITKNVESDESFKRFATGKETEQKNRKIISETELVQ